MKRSTGYEIVSFTSSLWEWQVCEFCKAAEDSTRLAQLLCSVKLKTRCLHRGDQASLRALPVSLFTFAPDFSHRLRLKRLAERDETAAALPATTQRFSIPGLPSLSPTAISSFLTLFNHTQLCRGSAKDLRF